MKPPSRGAMLLGAIPFVGMCFSVPVWDRVEPFVLGMPFNLFWLLGWLVLTSICLWGAYRLETRSERENGSRAGKERHRE